MVTIIVNRFWLSTPIDRPMVAMITSVEPRAFMPQASASDSRRVRPPICAAEEGAAEFADAGDQDQRRRSAAAMMGSFRMREVGAQARRGRRTPA